MEQDFNSLATRVAELEKSVRSASKLPQAEVARFGDILRLVQKRAIEMTQLARHAHAALYDNGLSIRLLPSMAPSVIEADRYRSEAAPWLSIQTVLFAPKALLTGYSESEVRKARQAFQDAAVAYRNREEPQRSAHFAAAMDEFATALRDMGEGG